MLRKTKQRRRILQVLRATNGHPTADWIYSQLKGEFPKLSLGTVYSNLRVLKGLGEITQFDFGGSSKRFNGRGDNHYHFTCDKCGKVFDINMPLERKLNMKGAKATGFNIEDHKLVFYGLCKECSE